MAKYCLYINLFTATTDCHKASKHLPKSKTNNSVQFPLYFIVVISGTVCSIFMGFQRGIALKLRNTMNMKTKFF